jgi:Domain of unknown function (DUF1993)
MTISMYKASAPIFVQFLTSLSTVLDKAAAHAEAKKIDTAVLLNTRLYPDMFPLARQVREPCRQCVWTRRRRRSADLHQRRGEHPRAQGAHRQDDRFHQGTEAGADRWHGGQRDYD